MQNTVHYLHLFGCQEWKEAAGKQCCGFSVIRDSIQNRHFRFSKKKGFVADEDELKKPQNIESYKWLLRYAKFRKHNFYIEILDDFNQYYCMHTCN